MPTAISNSPAIPAPGVPVYIRIETKIFHLSDSFTYQWEQNNLVHKITVPDNFRYDGATVPRLATWLTGIKRDGANLAASTLHDWLYYNKGYLSESFQIYRPDHKRWETIVTRWKRKQADRLFFKVLKQAGVNSFQRFLSFHFVRWLGWVRW